MSARQTRLDRLLETWARWTFTGGIEASGLTVLARWMENKGELIFGGQTGAKVPVDFIEQEIEATVLRLASARIDSADALRLEYCAGVDHVRRRRKMPAYDRATADQARIATAMNISLATYKRRLAEAKQAVKAALEAKGVVL